MHEQIADDASRVFTIAPPPRVNFRIPRLLPERATPRAPIEILTWLPVGIDFVVKPFSVFGIAAITRLAERRFADSALFNQARSLLVSGIHHELCADQQQRIGLRLNDAA